MILAWAERRNESVERLLFRHTSMDHGASSRLVGGKMPPYYISPAPPVWDAAVHGAWALQVGGLVAKPLRLALPDLMRLPRVTQRVNH